jgi:hypothetical protein
MFSSFLRIFQRAGEDYLLIQGGKRQEKKPEVLRKIFSFEKISPAMSAGVQFTICIALSLGV